MKGTHVSPLVVRGWSKAQGVSGTPDTGYSLYVDLLYTDGTPLWGQTANFRCGTHDWQQREVLIFPTKPVKSLTLHCMLRGHSGTAWFDDITVEELQGEPGAVVFDGIPVTVERRGIPVPPRYSSTASASFRTRDGLQLRMEGHTIISLRASGRELACDAPSGFLIRDAAAHSEFCRFEDGVCPELGLKLQAKLTARADHIRVEGRIIDTTERDRAVTLYFALPLSAVGWHWGDDIRRERVMNGTTEYTKLVPVGCGANGGMSLYPVAAVWNRRDGVALGLDMDKAAQFRIGCNPGTQLLFIAYDFGLVQEAKHFAGSAEFSFVLFRFDPEWGFRAAFEKYAGIFAEHFKVRSPDQGIWMPFTDVSTVAGWQDFGFRYHEGVNNVPWDDTHGVLSFRYTEPMTWWMPMAKDLPRTLPEALRLRDTLASNSAPHTRHMAQVTRVAGMWDESSEPALSFRDTPWCNGAVWSINPNPHLPVEQTRGGGTQETFNGATVYWNSTIQEKLYGPAAKGRQDGEYLDSLEGYVTADLNFRRDHFKWTTVPLTYTTDTFQPVLFKGLAVYEFTRWLSSEVHALHRLMFANGVPYRLSFLCPWLDVMGTETDWLRGGKFAPASDEQMSFWRTLSGKKPYLLLMNTDFDAFTPELVEKYFQRSLFYGMYPSMFSHNAADNPYWQQPKWYNRDRELFKKYIPIVRTLSTAGWEPVTRARCSNSQLYIERFGPGTGRKVYFSVLNDTQAPQEGELNIDLKKVGAKGPIHARDLVSGVPLTGRDAVRVELKPQQVAVIEVDQVK